MTLSTEVRWLRIIVAAAAAACGPSAAATFGFESPAHPSGSGAIISEPGAASNHVLRIETDRPHHSRWILPTNVPAGGFVLETRVRCEAWTGAPPVIWLYGLQPDGFAYARWSNGRVAAGRWRARGADGERATEAPAPGLSNSWTRLRLTVTDGAAAAMAWPDGAPPPLRWQTGGPVDATGITALAVGVWLPPAAPARATVLFDDILVRPVEASDLLARPFRTPGPVPMRPRPYVAQSGTSWIVAAGDLAVAFDAADGSLRRAVCGPADLDIVDSCHTNPLFRLTLTRPPGTPVAHLSSEEFRRLEWRAAPTALEGRWSDGPVAGLEAVMAATAGPDGWIRLRLAVSNAGDAAVSQIEFPIVVAPAALGDSGKDDRLLIPHSHTDGIVVREPAAIGRQLGGHHPGDAAVQMMALYDEAGGLLLSTHDAGGHVKRFTARTVANRSVQLSVTHLRPEIPGSAEVPYDVALAGFRGDWRDAADLYKRWAVAQPWCRRRLTERNDVPPFLKEGAAGVIFSIANEQGYNGIFGPELERVPEIAAAYRTRAGTPHMILVPYGWENRGTWAGIHYFPARPSDEAWRNAARSLKAQGDRMAMLISGFWWVVRRAATRGGPAFDDTAALERRRDMLIAQPDGAPWFVDFYDRVGQHGDWRGFSAQLCQGSEEARRTMLDIFLQAAALGAPLISFDQAIGGGQSAPCYAAAHGHPPGYGDWMWRSFMDLCDDIRRAGRAIEPEICLMTGNCQEMIIPAMATFWSRQFGVADHGTPGGETVGLFSYLYHEYVTAIGAAVVQGQGPQRAQPSPGLRCQALAHNLVRGLIPCPFATDVPLTPSSPRQRPIADAFFSFCRPYAAFPEFLILGETLRPPAIECAWREETYLPRPEQGQGATESARLVTVRLPCVLPGRFRSPDGSTATFLVNSTDRPQSAQIRPAEAGRAATLRQADGASERAWDVLPPGLEVELEPFGCRALVVNRAD